jgi:hypothetical protein
LLKAAVPNSMATMLTPPYSSRIEGLFRQHMVKAGTLTMNTISFWIKVVVLLIIALIVKMYFNITLF